jgi:hypothetical protein
MKHNALTRYILVAGGALVVGLLAAGTPLRSLLPLVLVLACPVMMMFMMRGMGGHGGHGGVPSQDTHDHHHDEADAERRL